MRHGARASRVGRNTRTFSKVDGCSMRGGAACSTGVVPPSSATGYGVELHDNDLLNRSFSLTVMRTELNSFHFCRRFSQKTEQCKPVSQRRNQKHLSLSD